MKRTVPLTFLLLLLCSCGQNTALRSTLYSVRSDYGLPAIAALIIKDGKIEANEAVGTTRIGGRVNVRTDSKWHLGACGRPMTVTLLAQLVEEGKLTWDSKVSDVLPETKASMDSAYRNLTLRMLLANRSGLAEDGPKSITWHQLYNLRSPLPEQRLNVAVEALKEQPAFRPGTDYRPSRTDYVVAAAMGEKVTGVAFETLLEDRIWKPLGMSSAGFGTQNYKGGEGQPIPHAVSTNGYYISIDPAKDADAPEVFNPAGNMHMMLTDWAKFIFFQLGLSSAPKLLSDKMIEELASPNWQFDWGATFTKREWSNGYIYVVRGSNGKNYAGGWAAPGVDFGVLIVSNAGRANDALDIAYKKLMAIFMPGAVVRPARD